MQQYGDGDASDLIENDTFHTDRLSSGNGLTYREVAIIKAYALRALHEKGNHRINAEKKLDEVFAAKDPAATLRVEIRKLADMKPSSEAELIRTDLMLQVLHTAMTGVAAAQAATRIPE